MRKTYNFNFLDAHKAERLEYRAKTKSIDDKNRVFVKQLDAKIRDAYIETEKQKKELRKNLFNTRKEIEEKLAQ